MLYELVTGAPPFRSESVLALMRMHMEAEPPRPPDMSPSVWDLVSTLLSKKPTDRGISASFVEHELREISAQANAEVHRPTKVKKSKKAPVSDHPNSPASKPTEPTQPHKNQGSEAAVSAMPGRPSEPTEINTEQSPQAFRNEPRQSAESDERTTSSTAEPPSKPTTPDAEEPNEPPHSKLHDPEPAAEGSSGSILAWTRELPLTRRLFTVGDGDGDAKRAPKRRTVIGVSLGLIAVLATATGIGLALNRDSSLEPAAQNPAAVTAPARMKSCWDASQVAENVPCPPLTGISALEWYAGLDPKADPDLRCTTDVVIHKSFQTYVEAIQCTWDGRTTIKNAFVTISRYRSSEFALSEQLRATSLATEPEVEAMNGRTRIYRAFGQQVSAESLNFDPKRYIRRVVDVFNVAPISISRTTYGPKNQKNAILTRMDVLNERIDPRDDEEIEKALASSKS